MSERERGQERRKGAREKKRREKREDRRETTAREREILGSAMFSIWARCRNMNDACLSGGVHGPKV
jgi:hypothetical protein